MTSRGADTARVILLAQYLGLMKPQPDRVEPNCTGLGLRLRCHELGLMKSQPQSLYILAVVLWFDLL
jgi:hypothetical protein